MAKRQRYLFLYLTLACFLGLIAIFISDGYMGVYDTLRITTGEQEQTIEPDYWLRQDRVWTTGVNRGEKAFFTYEVDNRRFTGLDTGVDVSLWQSQEKIGNILNILTQQQSIEPFATGKWEWAVDTAELVPGDAPPEQSYQYTVLIKRGETERRIILHTNPVPYPVKTVPTPPR